MEPTNTTPSRAQLFVVAFALGTPGGAILTVGFWWLLILVAHPAMADEWWEYALVAVYILAPLWAPLLTGFTVLRLAARLGWVDWRSA
jgi:hypothetical protein